MNNRKQIIDLCNQGANFESIYNLLHDIVNKGNPTFYETIVQSNEWEAWEKVSHKQYFDSACSRDTGWIGTEHFNAFLNFVRKDAIEKYISSPPTQITS